MDKSFQKVTVQNLVGLAALLNLLEEKGLLTEDECQKYYEEAKKVVINETFEQMKSELF